MRVTAPLFSRSASGTFAGKLIYRRARKNHSVYRHFTPIQPGSQAQMNHQALFGLLATRWDAFSATERDHWTELANLLEITPYNAYLQHSLVRLNPAATSGLQAWWPNVLPSGSVLHDISLYRKDGAFVSLNPDTAWQLDPTRRGKVIEFVSPGYVNIPSPPSTTGALTVAAWFKQNSYTINSALVDAHQTNGFCLGPFTDNKLRFRHRGNGVQTSTLLNTDFTWHHAAGVWDGTHIRIYLDGVEEESLYKPYPSFGQPTMWIGKGGIVGGAAVFDGRMDEVRLYHRALDPAEIVELAAR